MIVLVGFMGAGKSTVGEELARLVDLPFVDTDRLIEQRASASIADIFSRAGEPAFRAIEHECIAEVLGGDAAVVALGGGAVTDAATRSALHSSTVVYLKTSLETCLERVGEDARRPMLAGSDPEELYAARVELYEEVAGHVVETDAEAPQSLAAGIADLLGRKSTAASRRISVELPGRPYMVEVGHGLVGRLGRGVDLPDLGPAEKAVVVTHPTLEELAQTMLGGLRRLGLEVGVATVPEGERSKSLETASGLYEDLAAAGAHRHDLVVGFGGGVVTDLAGFVASTYQRGMPVVQVPTTLLGQVDAAIGGKTGVNLSHGKNLVGSIWQPAAVLCDVDLLEGLPEIELRAGLAEVIKYGLIDAPELLDFVMAEASNIFARDRRVLARIVEDSVAVKARIVAADEREAGVRAHLNYGHTFAHAFEQAAGYEGLRHGEAVALGMMAAAYLARELGRIDDGVVELHRNAVEAVGLATTAPHTLLDFEVLERAWQHDKKYRKGVRFVLLAGPGKPEAGIEVDREMLRRALGKLSEEVTE